MSSEMREFGWLIEEITGGTRWYRGASDVDADDPQEGWSGVVWTKDASKAIRFCRKVDAEMAMRTLGFDDPKHFAATEHVWVGPLLARTEAGAYKDDASGDAPMSEVEWLHDHLSSTLTSKGLDRAHEILARYPRPPYSEGQATTREPRQAWNAAMQAKEAK